MIIAIKLNIVCKYHEKSVKVAMVADSIYAYNLLFFSHSTKSFI